MSNSMPRPPYMLDEKHFMVMLALAVLVHLGAFVAWSFAPRQQVQDIIIRTMNVRLGDSEEDMVELQKPEDMMFNTPQMEAVIAQITQDLGGAQPLPQSRKNADDAKQYVREVSMPRKKPAGIASGARDAEVMSRYTQMISLWIQKFRITPPEAKLQNRKVTVVVRLRIDRRGTIRYYALEQPSGIEAVDRAALDMIRRANPVPAVPDDYPPGDAFEFLVPINFSQS